MLNTLNEDAVSGDSQDENFLAGLSVIYIELVSNVDTQTSIKWMLIEGR
jgi:hypothetical protein